MAIELFLFSNKKLKKKYALQYNPIPNRRYHMNRYLRILEKIIFSKSYFAGAAFFMMSICTIGHAHNISEYQMIVEAYKANNPCINTIQGNKIIINPAHISLSEEGIYLEITPSTSVELSYLLYDAEGMHILSKEYFYCSNCNIAYLNPGICRQCGKPLTRHRGI